MIDEQSEFDFVKWSYNEYGDEYAKKRLTTGLLFNEHIEAPTIRKILGNPKKIINKNALDIGCGPGKYTRMLLESGAKVTAIDPSHVMLKHATEHCQNLPNSAINNLSLIEDSFEHADLGNEKYHIILATFMLSYFRNLTEALEKMHRHLEKNGRIVSSILHPTRTYSSKRTSNGYIVENYFNGGYYAADFLNEQGPLPLKRYNHEELADHISQAGLRIESMLAPRASLTSDYPDKDKLLFYAHNPSILIITMKKR